MEKLTLIGEMTELMIDSRYKNTT